MSNRQDLNSHSMDTEDAPPASDVCISTIAFCHMIPAVNYVLLLFKSSSFSHLCRFENGNQKTNLNICMVSVHCKKQ